MRDLHKKLQPVAFSITTENSLNLKKNVKSNRVNHVEIFIVILIKV